MADGRVSGDAPLARQDNSREVENGATEIALAAARSARFFELKDLEPDAEQRAARVNEEVLGIEDGVRIYSPTPAQERLLALEDRQRVLALEDMDRRRDRPRGRQPTPSGPPIVLGDRAASSGARRPETLEEKRARHMREMRRGHERIREGPDADTRAQLNRSHARRVREQQRLSAVQG